MGVGARGQKEYKATDCVSTGVDPLCICGQNISQFPVHYRCKPSSIKELLKTGRFLLAFNFVDIISANYAEFKYERDGNCGRKLNWAALKSESFTFNVGQWPLKIDAMGN